MAQIAVWIILVYGCLVALGGILGYLKAKSNMSLISGLVSGVALLATWFFARTTPTTGLGLATLIAGILLIIFIVRFVRTRKFMPAGLMMILSLVSGIVFGLGWLA